MPSLDCQDLDRACGGRSTRPRKKLSDDQSPVHAPEEGWRVSLGCSRRIGPPGMRYSSSSMVVTSRTWAFPGTAWAADQFGESWPWRSGAPSLGHTRRALLLFCSGLKDSGSLGGASFKRTHQGTGRSAGDRARVSWCRWPKNVSTRQ